MDLNLSIFEKIKLSLFGLGGIVAIAYFIVYLIGVLIRSLKR